MKISKIILYDEPTAPEIDMAGILTFIRKTFGVQCEIRDSITRACDRSTALEIAASRVHDLDSKFQRHVPSAEQVGLELGGAGDARTAATTYYDGYELQNALGRMLPRDELEQDMFHIIFTTRLTCTFDASDRRYHGRALVGSNPSVISTTGMVEAPAKPRAYYTDLMARSMAGLDTDGMLEKYRGRFLEYGDTRLAGAARIYVAQAIFYYETQEPFCGEKGCMLYNSHWQADLLSQIGAGQLCRRHQDMLERMTMT